jgi:transcriptional regulator with XRE-family HTH domain
MTFGEKLRQARKAAGMTQKELAQAVELKHNAVSNWEKGVSSPDPDTIRRLCEILRMPPNFFFDTEESAALSGVEFALFGEVRQLSPEDQQDVLNFIRYKRSLQEKRKDDDQTH